MDMAQLQSTRSPNVSRYFQTGALAYLIWDGKMDMRRKCVSNGRTRYTRGAVYTDHLWGYMR
jgi:hypothetical protein